MSRARITWLATVVCLAAVVEVAPESAGCANTGPSVITDKSEYRAGDTVSISGCGFGYQEPVSIVVTGPDGTVRSANAQGRAGKYDWIADENGAFTVRYELEPRQTARAKDSGRYQVSVMTGAGLPLASTGFLSIASSSTDSPDFFWLPPTVPTAPPFTGPFDADALDELAVEVCRLDDAGRCIDGPPVERLDASSSPTPARISLDPAGEFYTVQWQTGRSHVDRDANYRVTVLQADVEIGSIDVDLVQNPPALAAVDATRFLGVVRGQQLTLRFRVQIPTARTRVKVNEVESQAGVPGDWIEFRNTAPVPVSLAGYVVKDNDDTHLYTFPDGAEIPANGYYVAEEAALDFGLGGADSARLFTPDGAVLVDSFTWPAHAATTWGRCPDGTGDFQVMTSVTKGSVNDCTIVVRINEVESEGGTPGDWIELYNPGPGPANLKGFVLRDGDDAHTFVLPATLMPADSYLVLDQSEFGFSLDDVDAARLTWPDGLQTDAVSWSAHAPSTLGRCPNGIGTFGHTLGATRGGPNQCFVPITTLRINEVESQGGVPGDWFELVNVGATAIDLTGWRMLDNDNTHVPYAFPAGTTIAPGGYLAVDESSFIFGLGAAESVRLFDPNGAVYEEYSWTAHAATTYGRCPTGTGPFITTNSPTKGAANSCGPQIAVHINEVESNGGTPGDWFELVNTGATPANLSGFSMLDNDDNHAPYVFPAGTIVAPGNYLVVEETQFVFGLGGADSVRLFDATGQPYESYSWTAHAATTYGRCPNGTGEFVTMAASTKGISNNCGNPIKINEVESNSGDPGDWVELFNPSASPVAIGGLIFRDNDDTHTYVIPIGTTVAANGYYLIEETAIGFGLGGADSARLFDGTQLLDSYAWTAHASTTYGRCPNGTGSFTTNAQSTKGAANACSTGPAASAWPGSASVATTDGTDVLGGNMSGLVYEGSGTSSPGVLWGVKNGPGSLYRLLWDDVAKLWQPDTANGWNAGKTLLYPGGGTGSPDTEGVTFAENGPSGGMYVSTERDNNNSGVSRNTVLLFNPSGAGTSLTATVEWNLTADLPVTGNNAGIEGITWVPDSFLVSRQFFDEGKGHTYNPADYPNHGTGLFFLGIEATGQIFAYALDDFGGFSKVATIASGFAGVMDLHFDRETLDLWAICDDGCGGQAAVLRIDAATHKFVVARLFDRPAAMPNINNEGFAVAPQAECTGGSRPVFWADDANTGGHAIRAGAMLCTAVP